MKKEKANVLCQCGWVDSLLDFVTSCTIFWPETKTAYSKHKGGRYYNDPYTGERRYLDGSYGGHVPGLACPSHRGKTREHIAECDGNPKFGTGKGNDNVYECDGFAF